MLLIALLLAVKYVQSIVLPNMQGWGVLTELLSKVWPLILRLFRQNLACKPPTVIHPKTDLQDFKILEKRNQYDVHFSPSPEKGYDSRWLRAAVARPSQQCNHLWTEPQEVQQCRGQLWASLCALLKHEAPPLSLPVESVTVKPHSIEILRVFVSSNSSAGCCALSIAVLF